MAPALQAVALALRAVLATCPASPTCPQDDQCSYTANGVSFQVSCATDYYGGDLSLAYTSTLTGCMNACSTTASCVAASYVGGNCYLKSTLNAAAANANVIGVAVTSRESTTAPAPGSPQQTCPASFTCPENDGCAYTEGSRTLTLSCGMDFYGGDFANQYAQSLEACTQACAESTECVAASFVGGNAAGTCYLKSTKNNGNVNNNVDGVYVITATASSTSATPATSTAVSSTSSDVISSTESSTSSTMSSTSILSSTVLSSTDAAQSTSQTISSSSSSQSTDLSSSFASSTSDASSTMSSTPSSSFSSPATATVTSTPEAASSTQTSTQVVSSSTSLASDTASSVSSLDIASTSTTSTSSTSTSTTSTSTTSASSSPSPVSVITDGGFESADTSPWIIKFSSPTILTYNFADPTSPHSGSQVGSITYKVRSSIQAWFSQSINLQANTVYNFSAWTRASIANPGCNVYYYIGSADGSTVLQIMVTIGSNALTTSWMQSTASYNSGAGGALTFNVRTTCGNIILNTSRSYYFDDISLVPA